MVIKRHLAGATVAGTSDGVAAPDAGYTSQEPFCDAIDHLIDLLAPINRTSPAETRADFEEAIVWFAEAEQAAPPAIDDDVADVTTQDQRCDVVHEVDEMLTESDAASGANAWFDRLPSPFRLPGAGSDRSTRV
jgi:hypothetical protein